MRVIFLDVDGVLNSGVHNNMCKKDEASELYINELMAKRLSKLYTKFNDTILVLSSDWKEVPSSNYNLLEQKLGEYGIEIFGRTAIVNSNRNRPQEIKRWLKTHKGLNIDYWVSLDDDYDYKDYDLAEYGFSNHLCKTEFGKLEDKIDDTGFTNLKYHVALEILEGIY